MYAYVHLDACGFYRFLGVIIIIISPVEGFIKYIRKISGGDVDTCIIPQVVFDAFGSSFICVLFTAVLTNPRKSWLANFI